MTSNDPLRCEAAVHAHGPALLQAAALVCAGVNDDKKAVEYMKQISRMVKLIEIEGQLA